MEIEKLDVLLEPERWENAVSSVFKGRVWNLLSQPVRDSLINNWVRLDNVADITGLEILRLRVLQWLKRDKDVQILEYPSPLQFEHPAEEDGCYLDTALKKLVEEPSVDFVEQLLQNQLGIRGVQQLLLFRTTIGTVDLIPPTRPELIQSFEAPHLPSSSKFGPRDAIPLTVGARALSKHCHRSGDGWWGACNGSHEKKNELAKAKLLQLLDLVIWVNVHVVPVGNGKVQPVVEIRVSEGFGARWGLQDDGHIEQFRGFLEPPMKDGHEKKWRH